MDILSKLFENKTRVKLLRLFLFNVESIFDIEEIKIRTKSQAQIIRKEINMMEKINLIKKRSFYKEFEKKKGKKKIKIKKRVQGWILNEDFIYIGSIQQFFIRTSTLREKEILSRLRKSGKLKVVIISGFFIQDWDNRLDMLVVGDGLNDKKLESEIKNIESEVGMELRYATFKTDEFKYRISIRDKLIRDILDYPHRVLVDKLDILDL